MMDSTKIFLQNNRNLKSEIYKKYRVDFEEIKDKLLISLIKVYGNEYEKFIKKELDKIHLISYFNRIDLEDYFEYQRNYGFSPIILDTKKLDDKTNDLQDDLEKKFEKLFKESTLKKIPKRFDKLIYDYLEECTDYRSNLGDEYYSKYCIGEKNLNEKVYEKRDNEYNQNTGFFDFAKEEVSKLELLLNSNFLLSKNGVQELKDLFRNTKLCHNINGNKEKSDIIFINPITFDEETHSLYLVKDIVESINTSVNMIDDITYEFNRGLKDTFIRKLNDIGFDSQYDTRRYEVIIEYINYCIACEVLKDFYYRNNYIIFPKKEEVVIKYGKNTLLKFYENFNKEIINSIVNKKEELIFNKISNEKYEKFMDLIEKYLVEFENILKNSSKGMDNLEKCENDLRNCIEEMKEISEG